MGHQNSTAVLCAGREVDAQEQGSSGSENFLRRNLFVVVILVVVPFVLVAEK